TIIIIDYIIVMRSCGKEKLTYLGALQETTEEAYVIGVNPCTFPIGHSGTVDSLDGFVLRLVESNDTVVTYNLSKEIVNRVDYLENSYLFNKEMRDSLKVRITYIETPQKEKYYPICLANIYTGDYSKAVEDGQVVVLDAQRTD